MRVEQYAQASIYACTHTHTLTHANTNQIQPSQIKYTVKYSLSRLNAFFIHWYTYIDFADRRLYLSNYVYYSSSRPLITSWNFRYFFLLLHSFFFLCATTIEKWNCFFLLLALCARVRVCVVSFCLSEFQCLNSISDSNALERDLKIHERNTHFQ